MVEIVGGDQYTTLADAVAAANESEGVTIKMLTNYTTADNESIVFTKNATLDLNDTTLTFSDGQRYGKKLAVGTLNATTPEVTFQNGTIVFACYPDDTACGRGVNVFGTLNVACTITQTCDNPAKTGQPIFDCYGASVVNIGEGAVIEGLYGDVFRTKDDVTDEPDVTINITGGSVMSAHSDDGIFYLMKPAPAMVANITGGELSFKTSAFAKRNYQTLKCELDDTCGAKFDCNTGNLADYIKAGYEAVKGDDEWYTIQAIPSFDVTFTVDEEEIPDSATNVLRDTTLTADMIPDVTDLEGAWDVNPVGAVITCETNFNFTTVKYVTITLPQTLPEGVTALVVSQSVDGVEWELVEGNQIVEGNQYVVVATADEGYTIQNPIKSGTADANIEVTDTDFDGKITPPAPAIDVAKIGDTFYKDLHEALTAAKANETVEIIADIDLKNAEWTPVAFAKKTLLGNSHIVSNLNVVGTSGYAGFIGDASGSKIKDLIIENVTVNATGCSGVAAVAGYFDGGSLASNVTVRGNIQVTGYKYVGGIVGNSGNDKDKIIDCSMIGDGAATSFIQIPTTGDGQVGGIAGYAAAVKVFGCKVQNLTVVGPGKVGGLLGRHHNGCDAVNCSVDNVIVKSDATHMGAAVGQCGENAPYLINCEVTDTVLQGMDGSEKPFVIYGTKLTDGKAYVYATNVVGQTMNAYASKYNFTAGDFNIDYEDGVTAVEADLAYGFELVATGDGNWYTIAAIPTFEVAAISVDNATVVATNTVTEEALALPATVLRDTEIAVTVTPNADYEYATAPAGWIKNDNGSITTNATVTADLAITVEAPTAAAAPWPVIPEFPADADEEVKAKYADWAKTYGVTDPAGTSDAFLMNDDPKAGTTTALEIKSIEVADGVATIKVAAGDKNLETGINGKLFVSATDDLAGEWVTTEVKTPKFFENEGKTAVFEVEGAQFMKAKVDFKVEEVEKQ